MIALVLLAAAAPGGPQLGITEGLLIALVGAGAGILTARISSREARGSTHDQIVQARDAKLWQTLTEDNNRLRDKVSELEQVIDRQDERIAGQDQRLADLERRLGGTAD
jgi:hypothetical protein